VILSPSTPKESATTSNTASVSAPSAEKEKEKENENENRNETDETSVELESKPSLDVKIKELEITDTANGTSGRAKRPAVSLTRFLRETEKRRRSALDEIIGLN
jgi:hypothetical protein